MPSNRRFKLASFGIPTSTTQALATWQLRPFALETARGVEYKLTSWTLDGGQEDLSDYPT